MAAETGHDPVRRGLISSAMGGIAVSVVGSCPTPAGAADYASPKVALDDLDRLAAICAMRLEALGAARPDAMVLVSRFLATLQGQKKVREEVRRTFGWSAGIDSPEVGEVDGELSGLLQSLDDLMVAYAESLPVFGDSAVVSRLAVDMVEISKRRTVIDLWAASEAA